jgi:hypothetical protein
MRQIKRRFLLCLFISISNILALGVALSAENEARPDPQTSITIPELKDHMFFLASDELKGRLTASPEYRIAANYCVSQLRAAGLKPLVPDEKGNLSFLQRVPLIHKVLRAQDALCLKNLEGETCFSHGDQCLVAMVQYPEDTKVLVTPPVFVGYGISAAEAGWDDYQDLNVEGKIVVCLHGAPRVQGNPVLPARDDELYSDLEKGGALKLQTAERHRAAGLVYILDPQTARAWEMIKQMKIFTHDVLHYPGREPHPPRKMIPVVLLHPSAVRRMFEIYNYDPFAHQNTEDENVIKRFLMDKTILKMQLEYIRENVECQNVVAITPGTDEAVGNQWIIVGAHLDHIGVRNGLVYNGADDNASGCAAVLEVAEAIAMGPTRRPVIFILYTGEEFGLYGSTYFTEHCPVPLNQVAVSINMDMVGREGLEINVKGGIKAFGPAQKYLWLKEELEKANENSVNIPIDFTHPKEDSERFFKVGDHFSFYKNGIPVIFFEDGGTEDLHKPTDDPEKIDFSKLQKVSQLVYALVMELGNTDENLQMRSQQRQ